MEKVRAILQGGLGNYMFQIAAAKSYAKKHNKEAVFNVSESSGPHKSITTYDGNVFNDIDLYYNFNNISPWNHFNENGFHYSEIPNIDGNVVLRGYFQSWKYFKENELDIITSFSFSPKLQEYIDVFINDTLNIDGFYEKNTCSIHVRRGDYLKYPNHHPIQNMNYYMKAIRKMPKDSLFLIFSDDIEWCKNNFPDLPEKFIFVEGQKDYEDLILMHLCKNNIICNSTFSWWGAWLNNNEDKIVVAPKNWFGPALSNNDTKDLYCENWIII